MSDIVLSIIVNRQLLLGDINLYPTIVGTLISIRINLSLKE